MINVILADHQRIYRIGMAGALAAEDDIRIVGQPTSTDQLLSSLQNFRAHVLILSSAFMEKIDQIKQLAARQRTAILLLEDSGKSGPVRPSSDVQGVMQRSAAESTAIRCIRHLARGGRVLRLSRLHHPVDPSWDSVGLRVRERLTHLELRIIAMIVRGYKNRQIAAQMGTTEQGVKNSLRRIFDKTGVFDRLELALFVIHHGITGSGVPVEHLRATVGSLPDRLPLRDPGYRRAAN